MGAALVKRAFKYRFYPTEEQTAELSRTFGCVRLVYNKALEARAEAWQAERRHVSYSCTSEMLTAWKRTEELAFLGDVSCVPLQQALRHLNVAFGNFFAKRSRHPRFKSRKRSRASAEYTRSAFRWRDGQLSLAKMNEPLRIVWSRPLPDDARPSTVTVSGDSAGRWFVSILVEAEVGHHPQASNAAVGIDAGLTALVTLSTGEKIANPKHERRDRERLAKAMRSLARKQKGSSNREKARRVVARVHARITDRRRDFLHKTTSRLVRENQAIVIEDLNVSAMRRGNRLAASLSDASWRQLRFMLTYKAAWYGRELIAIDRWFPSTKSCSTCGHVVNALPLSVREWTCRCGAVHDRDVNAAKNVLAAGLAVMACGDGGRPIRCQPQRQLSQPPPSRG
ncbi:RNA-guided endonuclease InsQ/TnpB family protein [Lentzea sp. JNUCC 0626]|uniref:RNA-guided endonuclease InsQ/TnpB family protein n=1 Tax=Lentzea sp. JNUCC 0626 TaxID=3367513 RepID=UPI003747B457